MVLCRHDVAEQNPKHIAHGDAVAILLEKEVLLGKEAARRPGKAQRPVHLVLRSVVVDLAQLGSLEARREAERRIANLGGMPRW